MLTAYSLADIAALLDRNLPSVVSIGNFDGVHLGHQAILRQVRQHAATLNARSVVITFEPHPSLVLRTGPRTPLITQLPEKLELLAATGVDLAVVLPFTDDLRTLSALAFTQTILCDALHTVAIHEGEGFRLGHRAEADLTGLRRIGQDLGFSVHGHPALMKRGKAISSSRIRMLVAEGELSAARALLGRPFALSSTPARGRGYGTRYAVPTINLAETRESPATGCPSLIPANGVYATTLRIGSGPDAVEFEGVTNVGDRPTFGEDSFAVETHLFDFTAIALDETTPLRLSFLHRLREERRFASPEQLRTQIGFDVARAQRLLQLSRKVGAKGSIPGVSGDDQQVS